MKTDLFKDFNNLMELQEKELILEEKIYDCMPKYVNHNISTDFLSQMNNRIKEGILREHFIQMGMFGFVSWKWINPFVEWVNGRSCLEVMAGRGWLSHALRQKGVEVIARMIIHGQTIRIKVGKTPLQRLKS